MSILNKLKKDVMSELKDMKEDIESNQWIQSNRENKEFVRARMKQVGEQHLSLACGLFNCKKCNGYQEGRFASRMKNPTPCGCVHHEVEGQFSKIG